MKKNNVIALIALALSLNSVTARNRRSEQTKIKNAAKLPALVSVHYENGNISSEVLIAHKGINQEVVLHPAKKITAQFEVNGDYSKNMATIEAPKPMVVYVIKHGATEEDIIIVEE